MTKTPKTFGRWRSDISPEHVAGKTLRFGLIQSQDHYIYWTECRPAEKGRCVIMRCQTANPNNPSAPHSPQELLPAPYSARSSVHEYGGGEFLATKDTLFFINADDQQIYQLPLSATSSDHPSTPTAITQQENYRFTDICIDQNRNCLISVAEIHQKTSRSKQAKTPKNCLVCIQLSAPIQDRVSILVQGHDFYASPTLNPDNTTLAWISWNLPDMPWESAALFIGELTPKAKTPHLSKISQIAGDGSNAVFQPQWHQDGALYFIWDKTGWSNLYRWTLDKTIAEEPKNMLDLPYDFGQPQWVFGMKKYAILSNGDIALSFSKQGCAKAGLFKPSTKTFAQDNTDKYELTGLEQVVATPSGFAGLALHHTKPQEIIELSVSLGKSFTIRQSAQITLKPSHISKGMPIKFKNDKQQDVFGVFYPPAHNDYKGKSDTQPPCIFNVHGGPSAAVSRGLNLKIQYWTNRGFGWCDIDYSGSTGYGKAYRQRLDGQWGIADVNDIISGANHLIAEQKIHPQQCAISGSSAGGLTVLNALANSTIFSAGASYYGVTDLVKLQETTHKFEAGYLFKLLDCTAENYKQILPKNAPLHHAHKITSPVIFFQGAEDAVVPLEQAQTMSAALEENNIPTKLFVFEGEGHGFRQFETIKTTLTEELKFYTQAFKLKDQP